MIWGNVAFVNTGFDKGATLHGYVIAMDCHREVLIPVQKWCSIIPYPVSTLQSKLHLIFAALFFLSLAYMSGRQFITREKARDESGIKRQTYENRLYRICAWIIVFTIAALIPAAIPGKLQEIYSDYKLVFFGEAICLWAFGISWLVKGIHLEKQNT